MSAARRGEARFKVDLITSSLIRFNLFFGEMMMMFILGLEIIMLLQETELHL